MATNKGCIGADCGSSSTRHTGWSSKDKKKALNTTIVIGIIAAFGVAIAAGVTSYLLNGYKVQQAREYLWRARSTNNLTTMQGYLQTTLDMIQPFTGNPVWFLPMPDTDFDLIKADIQTDINVLKVFADVPPTNTSYQYTVQNMQETLVELVDHLDLTIWWVTFNPVAAWMIAATSILGVVLAVLYLFRSGNNSY